MCGAQESPWVDQALECTAEPSMHVRNAIRRVFQWTDRGTIQSYELT